MHDIIQSLLVQYMILVQLYLEADLLMTGMSWLGNTEKLKEDAHRSAKGRIKKFKKTLIDLVTLYGEESGLDVCKLQQFIGEYDHEIDH